MKIYRFPALTALAVLVIVLSCQDEKIPEMENQKGPAALQFSAPKDLSMSANETYSVTPLSGSLKRKVKMYMAEYITSGTNQKLGSTVYFNDRGNKQLGADFVPSLSLDGSPNISYYVDNLRPSNDLSVRVTENAISRAMRSWDQVNCSNLGINKVRAVNSNTGLIALILGYGGSARYIADINHAGWLPKPFFDFLAPEGGSSILAVTFTVTFVDDYGNPLDSDNDNKADVAWREIYYNDAFNWNDGSNYDVETIALHESGHGLSQAHFGKAFRSGKGKLHFTPRAVMNAAYSGIQTSAGKTDLGGHCSVWGSWPN